MTFQSHGCGASRCHTQRLFSLVLINTGIRRLTERRHSLLGLPLPPGRDEGMAIKTWVKSGITHSRTEGQLGEGKREGLGDEWRLHHHFWAAHKKCRNMWQVSVCDNNSDSVIWWITVTGYFRDCVSIPHTECRLLAEDIYMYFSCVRMCQCTSMTAWQFFYTSLIVLYIINIFKHTFSI